MPTAPWALVKVPVPRRLMCSITQRLVAHFLASVSAVGVEDLALPLPDSKAVAIWNRRNLSIPGILLLALLASTVAKACRLAARASHRPCCGEIKAARHNKINDGAVLKHHLLLLVEMVELVPAAVLRRILLAAENTLDALCIVMVLADAQRHGLHVGQNERGLERVVHGAAGHRGVREGAHPADGCAVE
eukprot:1857773-Pleurochrysis_carterae.AAC.3